MRAGIAPSQAEGLVIRAERAGTDHLRSSKNSQDPASFARKGDGFANAVACYAQAVTDDDARQALMAILDDSKTFAELAAAVAAAYVENEGHRVFGDALRFIAERDAGVLDADLQERFAQVLSRMVESKEALALAAVLESRSE
jgi:hypothetical protein